MSETDESIPKGYVFVKEGEPYDFILVDQERTDATQSLPDGHYTMWVGPQDGYGRHAVDLSRHRHPDSRIVSKRYKAALIDLMLKEGETPPFVDIHHVDRKGIKIVFGLGGAAIVAGTLTYAAMRAAHKRNE